MTIVNKSTLFQRSILLLVLVVVFVVSVIGVCISLLIYRVPVKDTSEFEEKLNVLFIVVDDLRPALGCYGDTKALTPNIDQLASKSVLFKNAYAQQALCAPSRTSFLTSRRPDSLHLYDTGSYWRESVGNFTSLPQHFKHHGYETVSIGKVFHHGLVSGDTDDYPYSWTKVPYRPPTMEYKMSPVCPSTDGKLHMNLMCPVDVKDHPGGTLPDLENTQYAIEYLHNRSKDPENVTPFFLGVGFYKPHIPFKFPKEYLDLYPIESMDLAPNNTMPPKLPKVAWNPWTDLRERDDVKDLNVSFPYGPLPEDFQKIARQGYYASLSYMDDQVGQVLHALERTGFASRTAIVLVGDHGWSLGEHQEWSKYSNFEVSVRVPLLVYIPGITGDVDSRAPFVYIPSLTFAPHLNVTPPQFPTKHVTNDFVELVDIFPTLAEIANIAIPPLCKIYKTDFCSEGLSFYPVIENIVYDSPADFSWKTATFSQYPRPSLVAQENSDQPKLADIKIMGYTIRTKDFRYIEWLAFDNVNFKPNWATIISRELYDKINDPNEMNNLADEEMYANTVIELSKKLRLGWRGAMPPGLFDTTTRRKNIRRFNKSKTHH